MEDGSIWDCNEIIHGAFHPSGWNVHNTYRLVSFPITLLIVQSYEVADIQEKPQFEFLSVLELAICSTMMLSLGVDQ